MFKALSYLCYIFSPNLRPETGFCRYTSTQSQRVGQFWPNAVLLVLVRHLEGKGGTRGLLCRMFRAQGTLICYRKQFDSSCTWTFSRTDTQIRSFYVYTPGCDFRQKRKVINNSSFISQFLYLNLKFKFDDKDWVMNDEFFIIFLFKACLAKLRKITISSIVSLSLSLSLSLYVRMEQLDPHWTDFNGILYLSIFFRNLSRNFKIH